MKKYTALYIMIVLLLAPLGAHASHSLNITDYDTTVSGAKETVLNMAYMHDTTMNSFGAEKSYIVFGQYQLLHKNFYDSYNNSWSYTLSGSLNSVGQNNGITPPSKSNMKNLISTGSYSSYFMPEKNIYHGISALCSSQTIDDDKSPIFEEYQASVSYRVGMGHIIDITPLAEAGVIEDRLMEAGMLKGPLSKNDMLKLAEYIRKWRMGEYNYKDQDTAKGHFLADLSSVLESSGQLSRPLGGFSFWRISESRSVNYARTKGDNVSLALTAAHHSRLDHTVPGNVDSSSLQNNYFSLSYTRYFPIDWQSQYFFNIGNIVALNPEDSFPVNVYMLAFSYTYDLTNNVWLSANYNYERDNFQNDLDASDALSSKTYAFGINYKIEDFSITTLSLSRSSTDTWNATENIQFNQSFYM